MKVEVEIGQMHRFELREALLIYREGRRSFITRHDVLAQKQGSPILGVAQPLTTALSKTWLSRWAAAPQPKFCPRTSWQNQIGMIAWWTPRRRRQMFYEISEGKMRMLNGMLFPQPALVWKVIHGTLNIRALAENKRPDAGTRLAVAPFWNLSDDGSVCVGSMRCPESTSVASIEQWEKGFYESAFTHANVGRLTRHEGGHDALWVELAGTRRMFPEDSLIQLPQTLAEFIQGR
jgi:PRTRC genetic system protein B